MSDPRPPYGDTLDAGLGDRLMAGDVSADEFRILFRIFDNTDPRLPSLGVYLTIRTTYLLFCGDLATWTKAIVATVPASRALRERFNQAIRPAVPHTHDTAQEMLQQTPELQELVTRGTLMFLGLVRCRNWVYAANGYMLRGPQAIADIILQHLRDAPVDEVRLFMGVDERFDTSDMINSMGDDVRACAYVCAARAPELFLYRAPIFGLTTERLMRLLEVINDVGSYWLTAEQKAELVRAPWLPRVSRMMFAQRWGIMYHG